MLKIRAAFNAVLVVVLGTQCARSTTVLAGTILEVRLTKAVGSRLSHPGDSVQASVVAPIRTGEERVTLRGATLVGVVADSVSIGLGVKHPTAVLDLEFHTIRLADGSEIAADGKVVRVEEARERVDEEGRVIGIDPAANASSCLSLLISTGLHDSGLIPPAILFKLLAVRSPDPEILFPQGAELMVRLTHDVPLGAREAGEPELERLPQPDMVRVSDSLSRLPSQQTEMKHQQASDPVNVALIGTRRQVESAFAAAGWSGESPRSVVSLYRLYHCLVRRMGYGTAPMSRLTLNGVLPTKTYQKSLDTVSRRHHVRLWRQDSSDVWLAAATEDIGLTVHEMRITHLIDNQIDNERAKVANDLWFAGCVASGSAVPRPSFSPMRNGGTPIPTDGVVAVLRLRDCDGSGVLEMQANVRVSRLRFAASVLARDTLRANPVTLGLVLARGIPAWTASLGRRAVLAPSFVRPSVVN